MKENREYRMTGIHQQVDHLSPSKALLSIKGKGFF